MSMEFYWDSDAFLGFFNSDKNETEMDHLKQVLDAAERSEVRIYTSSLTLAEVVWIKNREKMDATKEMALRDWFEKPYLILINVDRRTSELARKLVWENAALRPKDALHVASALIARAKILHTFDKTLIGLDGIQGLKITTPGLPQPELPIKLG